MFGPRPHCDDDLRRRDNYCRIGKADYHGIPYKNFVFIDELPSKRRLDSSS